MTVATLRRHQQHSPEERELAMVRKDGYRGERGTVVDYGYDGSSGSGMSHRQQPKSKVGKGVKRAGAQDLDNSTFVTCSLQIRVKMLYFGLILVGILCVLLQISTIEVKIRNSEETFRNLLSSSSSLSRSGDHDTAHGTLLAVSGGEAGGTAEVDGESSSSGGVLGSVFGGGDGGSSKSGKKAPPRQLEKLDFETMTVGAPKCTPLQADDIKYTLVTQLSSDRLWMMGQHCARWGHANHISVAVFTDKSVKEVTKEMVSTGCKQRQITVQVLPTKKYDKAEYPVNTLRNMALAAVKTSHVMYVDVDFWEAVNLHEVLMKKSVREELSRDDKLAVVIPAFQIKRKCGKPNGCRNENIARMPDRTKDLTKLVIEEEAGVFDPTNWGGHGSTSYGAWYMQKTGEFFDIPCITSNRYEPYLAFRYCEDMPPFQEHFTGYGKNKMTWIMQLRHTGYDFAQLGGVFLVHYPHQASASRLAWNKGPRELSKGDRKQFRQAKRPNDLESVDWSSFRRGRMDQVFVQFRDWLYNQVPDNSRVVLCDEDQNDDLKLWV